MGGVREWTGWAHTRASYRERHWRDRDLEHKVRGVGDALGLAQLAVDGLLVKLGEEGRVPIHDLSVRRERGSARLIGG